jgi:CBS domain-containing protein
MGSGLAPAAVRQSIHRLERQGRNAMASTEYEDVEVLEGDEEEPEVGRHTDVGRMLLLTRVAEVMRRTAPVSLSTEVTVGRAVETMAKKKVSAVMVVEARKPRRLVGIFTERDFLLRSGTTRGLSRLPLKKVMSRDPERLRPKDSVAYALQKMSVGRFRHVPVVDDQAVPVGMITTRDLIDFLVELCPEEILNLPPQPELAFHPEREGA